MSSPVFPRRPPRSATPVLAGGVLMAAYLLLRPYGDAGSADEAAAAFDSARWPLAHLLGAAAIACVAWFVHRLLDGRGDRLAATARTLTVVGTGLTLLYYGAETFALPIAAELLAPIAAVDFAERLHTEPIATTVFAAGLLSLTIGALLFGAARARSGWTVWPAAIVVALFPVQYVLPPAGRIAFGLLYLAAMIIFAATLKHPPMRRSAVTPSLQIAAKTG